MKCKYAWTHLDFKPGGYAPCFRFKNKGYNLGKIPQLPSELINNDEWQNIRKDLQNDVWPAGCVDCKMQEEDGIKSYRQRSIEDHTLPEPNYNDTKIQVIDLQLKMSNACNYACRHCSSSSNSAFIKMGRDNVYIRDALNEHKFYHLEDTDDTIGIPTPEVIDDLFENILPTVERIEFSGGEPFYHVEMYRFLERMIADEKVDTQKIGLVYNTNMSLTEFKRYKIEDLWAHFKAIHLTVSMDGTGDLFNYFREKGDYQSVIDNIYHTLDKCDNIKSMFFVCTTTAYHAFYINEIANDLQELKQDVESKYNIDVNIRPTFVHWPKALDIVNLDEETKINILESLDKNDFTHEFEKRLKGKRTLPEETFKDVVKLQDMLHQRDASILAPRIFDYVY